jgi:hypothetical protein
MVSGVDLMRLGTNVDIAPEGQPIDIAVCPQAPAPLYRAKRVDVAPDGIPISVGVACESSQLRYSRIFDVAPDGQLINLGENPCCDSDDCVATGDAFHPCCAGIPGAIYMTVRWRLRMEWVDGPDDIFDGYEIDLDYGFAPGPDIYWWRGSEAVSGVGDRGGQPSLTPSTTDCAPGTAFQLGGSFTWWFSPFFPFTRILFPLAPEAGQTISLGTFCKAPCTFSFLNLRFQRDNVEGPISRYNAYFVAPPAMMMAMRAGEEESPPPCSHLGRDLTGPERQRNNLVHGKTWRLCLEGYGRKLEDGSVANCPCEGCRPSCPGYRVAPGATQEE